jgi:hypothetical protein
LDLAFYLLFQASVSTLPIMPEENIQQDLPITEDISKDTIQEERSIVDSPPKANFEDAHQTFPNAEMTNVTGDGSKLDDNVVVEPNPVAKN